MIERLLESFQSDDYVSVKALLMEWGDLERPIPGPAWFSWEPKQGDLARWTVLHLVCLHGYNSCSATAVKWLAAAGADLDVVCTLGLKPVHLAALPNWVKTLEALLDAGADPNSLSELPDPKVWALMENKSDYESVWDVFDRTPLMVAVSEGHLESVRLLVERGADVSRQDSSGRTALNYAANPFYKENLEILEYLRP